MIYKKVNCTRNGDIIEVIVRDTSFRKIFQAEANINNKKELEYLLKDLKSKGVDLIDIIRKKMIGDNGWFD